MLEDLLEVIFPSFSQNSQLNLQQIMWSDLIAYLENQSGIDTILTTDSEKFLSDGKNFIEPALPFENLKQRLLQSAQKILPDLVIISHCFFNSGMAFPDFVTFIKELSARAKFVIIDARQSYQYLPLDFTFTFSNVFFVTQDIDHENFQPFDYLKLTTPPYFQKTSERIHQFRNELITWDHFYFCEKNIISVDYNYHGPVIAFVMPSVEHAKKYHLDVKTMAKKVVSYKSRVIVDFRKN